MTDEILIQDRVRELGDVAEELHKIAATLTERRKELDYDEAPALAAKYNQLVQTLSGLANMTDRFVGEPA